MTKRLFEKTEAYGILCLCICTSLIPNITGDVPINEQVLENSLVINHLGDENSEICGYVTDNETGDALDDVDVRLYWEDQEGNYGWNSTPTNLQGLYHFTTAAVDFNLDFFHPLYFHGYSAWLTIGENEIYWFNISLVPVPEQTVHIQGFITDNSSGAPIEGAEILLYWMDNEGHYWENYTGSNTSGYYLIGGIPGRTQIIVDYLHYYFTYSTELFTQNNSIIWLNISLIPYPSITSKVCGYITDAELGDPIPDASVHLYCYTGSGQFYNYTHTDDIGFYSLGSIPGDVDIMAYKEDYGTSWSPDLVIGENETLWVNLTLTFYPSKNAHIKGYIIDNETHAVVRNAFIRYDWKDEVGHFYSESTFTDQKGYYTISAPAGAVQFHIMGNGYTNQQTSWFFIEQNSDHWLNSTLSPEITLTFMKPQPGIYINNVSRFPILSKLLSRFFPTSKPLIIGPLEITVNIMKSTLGCNRVEFYIDTLYRGTDSNAPFTYYWNLTGVFKPTHEIRVIAYDNAGPCSIETITVRKIM